MSKQSAAEKLVEGGAEENKQGRVSGGYVGSDSEPKTGEVIASPGTGVDRQLPSALASLTDEIMNDAGLGTSQAAEDNIIPMVIILQSQTPQAMPHKPEYIDGAGAGDIWLRGLNVVAPGDGGIVVQPVHFSKAFVEWIPRNRGGGFVAAHADVPEDVVEKPHPTNPDRTILIRKNGNEIIETRYHGVLVNGAPFVIPMASTAHTVSRSWMALMNSFKLPNGKPQPSWMRKYLLTTFLRKNPSGEWFTWKVEDLGPISSVLEYSEGKQLYLAMSSGEMKAEQPTDLGVSQEGEDLGADDAGM